MVTALPGQPFESQNPYYATVTAWMNGVALNVNELNAQHVSHAANSSHLPVGGANGYVLAKTSATDYAVGWVAGGGGGGSMTPPVALTGTDPATIPLSVTGAAAQASSLFNVYQNGVATPVLSLTNTAELRVGTGTTTINGTVRASNTDPLRRGFAFRAAAGQSAALFEASDSAGNSLFSVGATGTVTAPNIGAKVIVLNSVDAIPAGTPAGTVILRRP